MGLYNVSCGIWDEFTANFYFLGAYFVCNKLVLVFAPKNSFITYAYICTQFYHGCIVHTHRSLGFGHCYTKIELLYTVLCISLSSLDKFVTTSSGRALIHCF